MIFLLLGGDTDCLQPAARSLRPVRVAADVAVHYAASSLTAEIGTSASASQAECRTWCESVLSECIAIGGSPTAGEANDAPPAQHDIWVDVLDAQSDILQEVLVNEASFAYLGRLLRSSSEA